MPDAVRLDILRTLREEAGLSQTDMARHCGLQGRQSHQTAGAWERGTMTPHVSRRGRIMLYLWDRLRLRQDPVRFEAVWAILVEEWDWEPINDGEWRQFTHVARTGIPPVTPTIISTVAAPASVAHESSSPPIPFQAPALTPHFVGREALLGQLSEHLLAPNAPRIVALVGMGGVGKTTLAIQVAHQLRDQFVDGILWAHTAISAPLDILNSWARAFGYDYSALHDVESCAAALRSALAGKQLLLILDDVTGVQQVRPLFLGAERCAVLLSTRSADVAVALGSNVLQLPELASAEGVQLLAKLLGGARVAHEQEAAVTICRSVHHLPLAVEIVGQLLAARRRRPLAQMAQRLQDVQYRLDLQISDRDVRTSFLVSWETLDEVHQRVFAHLALFGGRSFTAAALAAILMDEVDKVGEVGEVDEAGEVDEVMEQLDTLAARSLVNAVDGDRYRQHPLLADFAREQLGATRAPWQRFAVCQLAFARRHQHNYAALEPEWDNLMAGMATAHQLQAWQSVLDYADALTEPWFTRARYTQARQGYTWAVEAARIQQDRDALARTLQQSGSACLEQNEYATAQSFLAESLELALELESDPLVANAQWNLARIAVELADYAEATRLLISCKATRTAIRDVVGVAAVGYWQAMVAFRLQDLAEAAAVCQRILPVQMEYVDGVGQLRTLRLLTDIAIAQAYYEQAVTYCQRALTLAETTGEYGELGASLFNLAKIYRCLDNVPLAAQAIERASQIFRQIGSQMFYAFTLYESSHLQAKLGQLAEAVAVAQEAATMLRYLQDKFNLVTVLWHLGNLHSQQNEERQAIVYWREAYELAHPINHRLMVQLMQRLQVSNEVSSGVSTGISAS